jgi:hypothetical protein
MTDELSLRHSATWLIVGITVMLGTALISFSLIVADEEPFVTDHWQQGVAVLGAFMVIGAIEFRFKKYVFRPDSAAAWYWFHWHHIDLPALVDVVPMTDHAVALADAESGRILLRITREFTRDGQVLFDIKNFYRQHARLHDV